MARVCYVILVHNEPVNLFGLLGSLWNPHDAFFVWIDGKADRAFVECARAAVRFGENVQVCTGSVMAWGGFSIVETTLTAYARLRAQVGQFSHVVLCSGTHIPLNHPDAIFERIMGVPAWMDLMEAKVQKDGLSQAESLPPGWWRQMMMRIRYRYVEVPGMGMIVAGLREAWNSTVLLAGSQWHVLRSDLVDFILENESRVYATFHDVLIADELAFQWITARWPLIASVRRGNVVWVEWAGGSPRRVSLAEAAEKAAAGRFLFARKAAADCTIGGWSEWAGEMLGNREGADRLKEVAATVDWEATRQQNTHVGGELSADGRVLLQSLADAVSTAGAPAELQCVNARRCLIATGRHIGKRGPVWLVCTVEPRIGISVIAALRGPVPGEAHDRMRLPPGLPGLPEFTYLRMNGCSYWTIADGSAATDIEAIANDIAEHESAVWSQSMNDRQIDNRPWLANIVKGLSFADVGGLWGTVNERVSTALLAGAREATMVDITPLGHSLWEQFHTRCRELGVSGYKCVSADATSPDLRQKVGTFEVVHCSGVIYHVPDLVAFVRSLISITTRYLILQSMVVPASIQNECGVLDISGGQCLFVPLLNETQRRIAGMHFQQLGLRVPHVSGSPVKSWLNRDVWNYAPWSWLITPDFLRGLVQTCGLCIIDEGFAWEDRTYSVLCEIPHASSSAPAAAGFSQVVGNTSSVLVDLSLHKHATQSSLSQWSVGTTVEEDAGRALSLNPQMPYAFHTAYEDNPWWSVDLEDVCVVKQLIVINRDATDELAERALPLHASISLDGREWSSLFWTPDGLEAGKGGLPLVWTAAEPVKTRFVRLTVGKASWLHLRQVRVLGSSR